MVLCRAAYAGLIGLALLVTGCAGLAPVDSRDGSGPAPPGYYRIRRGDTLSEIAERRRISMRKLAAWNRLRPPYAIYVGKLLRVEPPDGGSPVIAQKGSGGSRAKAKSSKKASTKGSVQPVKMVTQPSGPPGSAASGSGVNWQWPLSGPVTQTFRTGDRTRQGIRIGAAPGSPVLAAADGVVVYSGSGLKAYGNLIIVKHNARFLSAYGFNRRLLVAEGAAVKRGQGLAEAGQSADGQPMLHFEIRRDGAAVDPLLYLPASR